MTKNNYEKLQKLMHEFYIDYCPCHDAEGNYTGCVGYQNCEFGEDGCYGESCAIEDCMSAISYYYHENK